MSTDFFEQWQQNGNRPAWVQNNRRKLENATGLDIPVGRASIDDWLERYAGVVTRKLKNADDADADETSSNTDESDENETDQ